MKEKTLGFIGAGRVTRIILGGLKRAGKIPQNIVACDTNAEVLGKLQSAFPEVQPALNDNRQAATKDLVFLALHPPAIPNCLAEVRECLRPDAVVISLAPKVTLVKLRDGLGDFSRIVRFIPNAASIVGMGFNPIVFSQTLRQEEKEEIKNFLTALGKCPEVAENKLEAYAVITAMGPTYQWFQWQELCQIAESIGMGADEAKTGVSEMVAGALHAFFESGMTPEEVIDLVPVKPLGEEEQTIKQIYRSKLVPLFEKLKV